MKMADFTGIVLAGGKSSRMGRDKGTLTLDGQTLQDRAAGILRQCFTEVLILRQDDQPGLGPIGGLQGLLEPRGGAPLGLGRGTTRAQGYVYLRLFFNWLVRYDYIERSPVARAEVPRKTAQHHLLSVKDVERLLELTAKTPRLRAWLVLGVFGGMRTSEVARALPEHIGETEILIPQTKSTDEVPRKRYVPILPALVRHLPKKWDCLGEDYIKRARQELVETMKWKEWPQNCLRHTAASMHLAMWQDAGKTAFFLGHSSPQMVNKTYARAVPQAEAERFWGL